jgi:myo-inositol-1(or 4)-monophosphatase
VGVVYDPFTDELWTAMRGQPARLNGRVIHVSRIRTLAECIASIGFAKNRSNLHRALPYFLWLSRRVRKIRMMGSAALALTYVASGGLILECAGGRFWFEPTPGKHKYRMIASNGLVHGKLPLPK